MIFHGLNHLQPIFSIESPCFVTRFNHQRFSDESRVPRMMRPTTCSEAQPIIPSSWWWVNHPQWWDIDRSIWLVGQGQPSEKWWSSSIGKISNPIYGKIKLMATKPPTSPWLWIKHQFSTWPPPPLAPGEMVRAYCKHQSWDVMGPMIPWWNVEWRPWETVLSVLTGCWTNHSFLGYHHYIHIYSI